MEERGNLDGAKGAYQRAEQRGHPGGAFSLAVMLHTQSDFQGAAAAYRRAASSPDDDVATFAREILSQYGETRETGGGAESVD